MTKLRHAAFNQDGSCIYICTDTGYTIYSILNSYTRCLHQHHTGLHKIYMLYISSLLCIVGTGEHNYLSPRTLLLYNTKIHSNICELYMKSTVLNVCVNMQRLVVVCEYKIHIFDLKTLALLHSIDTQQNAAGLCCISHSDSAQQYTAQQYIVYPSSSDTGELTVYDTLSLHILQTIRAHITPIQCICINSNNTLLATASAQGTVIRVFAIPSGDKLYTFRRGTTAATVRSMSFNNDSTYLALATTDSHTVHVFSMRVEHDAAYNADTSLSSTITHAVSSTLSMSPYTAGIPNTAHAISTSISDTASSAYNLLPTVISRNLTSAGNTFSSIISNQVNTVSQSITMPQLPQNIADVVEPQRHYTYITLKSDTYALAVNFARNDPNCLNVITTTGLYYSYVIDCETGQCKLIKEYNLLDTNNDTVSVKYHGSNAPGGAAKSTYDAVQRHSYDVSDRYVGIRYDAVQESSLPPTRTNSANNTNIAQSAAAVVQMPNTVDVHTNTAAAAPADAAPTTRHPVAVQPPAPAFNFFAPTPVPASTAAHQTADDDMFDTQYSASDEAEHSNTPPQTLFAPHADQKSISDSLILMDGLESLETHLHSLNDAQISEQLDSVDNSDYTPHSTAERKHDILSDSNPFGELQLAGSDTLQ